MLRPAEYIVVQRNPMRVPVRLLLVAVCTLALVLIGWQLGRQDAAMVRSLNADLQLQLSDAEQVLAEHRRQLGELAMAEPLDEGAQAQARQNIHSLSQTVAELERELRFYRAVMPRGDGRALQIASFELQPQDDGMLRYDVLLTRHFRASDVISGKLQVEISGTQGGRQKVITLGSVAELPAYPVPFEFRYFQSISGNLRLPKGFAPAQAKVTANSSALPKGSASRRFEWQDIEGVGGDELAARTPSETALLRKEG